MSTPAPPASSRLVAPRSTASGGGTGGGSSQPASPSAAAASAGNRGNARKPALQLNPTLTSTLRTQSHHADDYSPLPLGLTHAAGSGGPAEMDERLQVLERTCHKLVSIVGSSSGAGSNAAASPSAASAAVAALSAQVAALETKLAASLASSAEQRIELDLAREAQAAAEEKLAARLRSLESKWERESTAKMNHAAATVSAAAAAAKDGSKSASSPAAAAAAAAAGADSTQSRLDGLDTDIDNLYSLLADKFSGLHSALGSERTARVRFEADLRKFVLTFQTEFRGIVNALQTSMKAAHAGVEKVVRREIEARQEGARAAAESLALASQTAAKDHAQLRAELQKTAADLNGRITRIMEQSRTAASQSSLALQRADQAAVDATQAKDRATAAAARASAQQNANSATAASPSRFQSAASPASPLSGGLLPALPAGSTSSASAASASQSSSMAAVRNNAVPALSGSGSGSSSSSAALHARKPSSSVRESSPDKHRKNSSSISQQQQQSAQMSSPSAKSAAASASSSNSSSAASATAASMKSQIKLPAKAAASSHASSAAPTAAASSTPAASSSASAATAAASSPPAAPASSGSSGASRNRSTTASGETPAERQAAVRIQSVYRGWSVRHTQALEKAAPTMPPCARCGDKPAVKRCEQCSAAASASSSGNGTGNAGMFCQHCEQELHVTPEMRKHKRSYLLEEHKSRSQRLGASGIVATTPSSSPPSTAAATKHAAASSAASSSSPAAASASAAAAFVAPVSPFLRGDVLLSTLDALAPKPCASDPALVGQVVAVSTGLSHAAIVTAEGRVYMHGDNSCGQLGLGDGDRSGRAEPTLLPMPAPVLQVSAAHEHTLFRLADGSVWSCGSGMLGRLGTESDADAEAPQRVPLPLPATAISVATGQYNSGFILAPAAGSQCNRVFISGANAQGQCGLGHLTPQLTPALVTFPAGVNIVKLAFGDKHAVALSSVGDVWSWGSNEFGQLGNGEAVASSTDSVHQLKPQRVSYFTALKLHAIDVACGERHTHVLVRNTDGGSTALYSFGSGEEHLMGVFDNVDQFRPVLVDLAAAGAAGQCVSIATGQGLSMATLDCGDVFGWGYALESPTPKLMAALRGSSVQQVAVGSSSNLLVHLGPAQEVTHWLFESAEAPVPFEELRGRRLRDISVGSVHYTAIDGAGKLLVWGANADFQLGTGNAIDMPLPVTISLPVPLRTVVCAAMHSLALAADGSVWSWGSGMSGRCGVGGDGDVVRPTLLAALREEGGPMESLAIGQYNGGAVSSTGQAFVWGSNDGAQLGLGDFTPRLLPVKLPLLRPAKSGGAAAAASPPRVVSLSFGNKHAAAVCADGSAFSWGSNDFGQLGNGEIDVPGAVNEDDGSPMQHPPAPVTSLAQTALSRVVCGENTTFFVGRTKGLYACGSAETNQLGALTVDGGDQSLPLPIAAFASVRVRALSVGNLNCAAVVEPNGTTWGWGWALGEEPRVIEALRDSDVNIVACGLTDLVCST